MLGPGVCMIRIGLVVYAKLSYTWGLIFSASSRSDVFL